VKPFRRDEAKVPAVEKTDACVPIPGEKWRILIRTLPRIRTELTVYYPKTVLLFGSMARRLADPDVDLLPNDMDLILVGNNPPVGIRPEDYPVPVELHYFRVDAFVAIARSLRYDSKPVALAKLYSKNVAKGHARDVIAACLLLGPAYRNFGIEQIEMNGKVDPRDYSACRVLCGRTWWDRICRYARNRRGPWCRFSDRIVMADVFEP